MVVGCRGGNILPIEEQNFSEGMQGRREWRVIFEVLREKAYHLRILCSAKLSGVKEK